MEIKFIPGICITCRFFIVDSGGDRYPNYTHTWLMEGDNFNKGYCSVSDEIDKHFVVPGALEGIGQSEENQCPLWQMITLKFCVINDHGWYPERDGCIHCQREARMRSQGNEYNRLPRIKDPGG